MWRSKGAPELGFSKSGVREMRDSFIPCGIHLHEECLSSFGEIDAHGCNYQEESFPGLRESGFQKPKISVSRDSTRPRV